MVEKKPTIYGKKEGTIIEQERQHEHHLQRSRLAATFSL